MRLSRGAGLLGGALLAMAVTAACGTQLPNSAFKPTVLTQTVGPGATSVAPGQAPASAATQTQAEGQPVSSPGPAASVSQAPGVVVTGTSAPASALASGGARTTKGAAASASTKAKGALTASDRGITPTTITIGNIVSAGGIFGSEQFGVSKFGIQAYVSWINAHGGIDGRQVVLKTCNDNGDGSQNVACVKSLVDDQKVFALVGNNIYAYDGVSEVQTSATPDILGQQISNVYTKYSHLFTFGGTNLPRNNKDLGFDDNSYGTSEFGHFYHDHIGGKVVGVVYYDQQSSKAGADLFGQSYSAGGYTVKEYAVNLGLPNFSTTVAQMQADGVDVVGDAMDDNGNEKLCQAMEANTSFINQVKAKILTVSSWNQRVPASYKNSPKCRNLLVAGGTSRSYSDTADPGVAAFRAEMKKDFPQRESLMAQWSYEAWIAGQIFTQGMQACAPNPTRACLEAWMVTPNRLLYDNGDTGAMSWDPRPESAFGPGMTQRNCVSVARWSDSVGTWVPLSDVSKDCYTTPFYKYSLG